MKTKYNHRAFHEFRQAKFGFRLEPIFEIAPSQKMTLSSKVVKNDSKIMISLC
jgi:hypothetical protein